jgi:hypothetical protein
MHHGYPLPRTPCGQCFRPASAEQNYTNPQNYIKTQPNAHDLKPHNLVPICNIPKPHCEGSLLGSYSPRTRWTDPSPDKTAHYVASPRSRAGTSHGHQPNQQIDPNAVFSQQMLPMQAHRAAPVERGTRAPTQRKLTPALLHKLPCFALLSMHSRT